MWRRLFERCAEVGGPVHVHVAASVSGLTAGTIRARARREGWWQPHRDVVAPPGTSVTPRAWALAAIARLQGPDLDAPRPAALTRWSGLAAHGVGSTWPTRVQVAVPLDRAPEGGPRLEVVRSRTFELRELTTVAGLATFAAPVLVRHLAAVATPDALSGAIVDLVQQRQTTLEAVDAEHRRWPRYPGRSNLEAALARLGAAGRTDSPLELELRDRLLGAGIPLDTGQVRVPCRDGQAIHLDVGIAAIRFGIDADSMLAHATRTQLRSDVRRSNRLVDLDEDWRVLRATWEDLDRGFTDHLSLVREVVAAQSQRHLGVPWPLAADLAAGRCG